MEIIKIYDKSNKLFYVGGVVRDEILCVENLDIDLVYEGNAIEFAKSNNLELLQINEPFGTVRLNIEDEEIDIASTRREIYPKKGHLPQVETLGVSLSEDVKRRDFTINSLYKSVISGKIIDLVGGIEDLKHKKLRILHDQSFVDDPTRIIRALKFRMRFGFDLEQNTLKCQEEYLSNINYDMCYKRIKKELVETFGYSRKTSLSLENIFREFVDKGIYKLLGADVNILPYKEIEIPNNLKYQWIVYIGRLSDLSSLPLTRDEQKIINDFNSLKNLNLTNDLDIYKAFGKVESETILLYKSLVNYEIAEYYDNHLKNVKIQITGQDLIDLGYRPSKEFAEIFDTVLMEKFKNNNLTFDEEIQIVKRIKETRL